MAKIANRDARSLVQNEQEFDGSNLFARNEDGKYIVYSYGKHWPLVAKVKGKWYVCTEKTSASTQRQLSYCYPRHATATEVNHVAMRAALNT